MLRLPEVAAYAMLGECDASIQVCCRSVNLDNKQKMFYGIVCASLSGAVGSLFSPGFNVVTNDAFHNLDPGVKPLSVYTG